MNRLLSDGSFTNYGDISSNSIISSPWEHLGTISNYQVINISQFPVQWTQFDQFSGSLQMQTGVSYTISSMNLFGGSFLGEGLVTGDMNHQHGTVDLAWGQSVHTLTINGTYSQNSSATVIFQVIDSIRFSKFSMVCYLKMNYW
jgi:hypothetical protein